MAVKFCCSRLRYSCFVDSDSNLREYRREEDVAAVIVVVKLEAAAKILARIRKSRRGQRSLAWAKGGSSSPLRHQVQPPVSTKVSIQRLPAVSLPLLSPVGHTHILRHRNFSKYGRRSACAAQTGGANPKTQPQSR
jgi:hypothetical protein